MATGENVAGLLNLAVFAAAASIAYLGLDRFDPERSALKEAPEIAKGEFDRAIESIREFLLRLEVKPDGNPLPSFLSADSSIDCDTRFMRYILSGNYRTLGLHPCCWIQTFWRAPLFFYFMSRRDVYLIGILAAISLSIFFLISAATVWSIPIVDNTSSARWLFISLSAIIILVVAHVGMLYRNAELPSVLKKVASDMEGRINAMFSDMINRIVPPSSPAR